MKKKLMVMLSLVIACGSMHATGQAGSGPEAAERADESTAAQRNADDQSFARVENALILQEEIEIFAGTSGREEALEDNGDLRKELEQRKAMQEAYNNSLGRTAERVAVSGGSEVLDSDSEVLDSSEVPVSDLPEPPTEPSVIQGSKGGDSLDRTAERVAVSGGSEVLDSDSEVLDSDLPEPPTGPPVKPGGGMYFGLATCGTIAAIAVMYELLHWASVTRAKHDITIITAMMNPHSELSVDQFDELAQQLVVVSDQDKVAMHQLVEEHKVEDLKVYVENLLKSLENTHNSIGVFSRLHYGATHRFNQVRSFCSSAAHTTKGWFEKTKRFFSTQS